MHTTILGKLLRGNKIYTNNVKPIEHLLIIVGVKNSYVCSLQNTFLISNAVQWFEFFFLAISRLFSRLSRNIQAFGVFQEEASNSSIHV